MEDKIARESSMESEYAKTGVSPKDIAALRSWVQSQPHLPEISDISAADCIFDFPTGCLNVNKYVDNYVNEKRPTVEMLQNKDLNLILAYNCCERSLELSKSRIDTHFTSRTNFTNLFKDRVVDESIIKALKTYVMFLPEVSSYNKNPILFIRLIDFRVSSFLYTDMARSSIMLLDLMQYELGCVPDTIVLVDCTGASFAHLSKLDIQTFQECLGYVKDALFGKIDSIHFLNTPSFASTILRILRPIIPDELLRLVTFHESGARTIEKIVPVEYLPIESGGQYKTLQQISNESIEKLIANKDFFVRENKLRVTEALRPEKTTNTNDIYGIGGSFKTLDID